MEEEMKRRFTDLIKRRSELYKRVEHLEPEYYRQMQRIGEIENGLRTRGAVSQYQLNQQGEIIAQQKALVSKLSIELEELKEQVRQMESAVILYREAESLWVRVNEITVKLREARAGVPAISLEEAKQAADAAHQEVLRLHEREKEIIQQYQETKDRASVVAAEALKERIRAAQLNVEAALSSGNRNAYLKARRDIKELSATSAVKDNNRYNGSKRAFEAAQRKHGADAGASIWIAQQASRNGRPRVQLNAITQAQLKDIRIEKLDAQSWHSALQKRLDKIELVPKLEAELETLTAQARDVSERAFAADNGSETNLLKFNGVPERELLEMPSGGKRRRKGKTARRRRYRSKTRHV